MNNKSEQAKKTRRGELSTWRIGALLIAFFSVDAFAQKRTQGATSTQEPPRASHSHWSEARKLEVASNQMISAGTVGGGIQSGLSIPTVGSVTFGLSGEVGVGLSQDWQLSLPVTLIASSGTIFGLAIGPQYNFGEGTRMNQFFTNFRPGILVVGGVASFTLNAMVGKRFEVIPGVAYRPNFGVTFNADAGEASFDLAPLAVSIEI